MTMTTSPFLKTFWTFCGPQLFRILKRAETQGYVYQPNFLESTSDRVYQTIKTAVKTVYWCSPVVVVLLYRRDYFTAQGIKGLSVWASILFGIFVLSFVSRGIGRLVNTDYQTFIHTFLQSRSNPTVRTRAELAKYDFEFSFWPVDYTWNSGQDRDDNKKTQADTHTSGHRAQVKEQSSLLLRPLGYMAMHSFGQRMIYPGATSVVNFLLSSMLAQGRAQLIEEKGGQRAKILTEDKNELDTMFLDRRGRPGNGETLVISSEGNAGFYEIGCASTPIERGFSVLGWNRPGFGGSTGVPWPESERKACEAVVHYAIHKLGFEPRNIAVFAWSIGGYSAALMARDFPDLEFVVLDATFDDLVPLAISKMPPSWSSLVASSIRSYMDLNVGENLLDYQGPVLIIRRTRDEIISTDTPPDRVPVLASNRGNNLLLKLLQHRYPTIVDNTTLSMMQKFLGMNPARAEDLWRDLQVDSSVCQDVFSNHVSHHGAHFPMSLDISDEALKMRLSIFLIRKHLSDYESTHNAPLPAGFFDRPWSPGA